MLQLPPGLWIAIGLISGDRQTMLAVSTLNRGIYLQLQDPTSFLTLMDIQCDIESGGVRRIDCESDEEAYEGSYLKCFDCFFSDLRGDDSFGDLDYNDKAYLKDYHIDGCSSCNETDGSNIGDEEIDLMNKDKDLEISEVIGAMKEKDFVVKSDLCSCKPTSDNSSTIDQAVNANTFISTTRMKRLRLDSTE